MYRRGDAIARVELRKIQLSVALRSFFFAGKGISFRARPTDEGFEVTVRRTGRWYQIAKFQIRVVHYQKKGYPLSGIACAKCKRYSYNLLLYLDWDTMTAQCRKCMGLTGYYIPEGYHLGDYDERAKFLKLVRKKFRYEAVAHEVKAIKSLPPEEFFADRPYLVPPFFCFIKSLEPEIYKKALKELRKRYMKCLRAKFTNRMLNMNLDWIDRQMEQRIINGYTISDKESECLKRQWEVFAGSQSGTALGPLSSPPTETGSSSSKTRSNPGTIAGLAKARAVRLAKIAAAKAAISASPESSNAPPVTPPEPSNARTATEREPCLSSPTSPSADPLPEESCLAATK
jgi:hypothetical protein